MPRPMATADAKSVAPVSENGDTVMGNLRNPGMGRSAASYGAVPTGQRPGQSACERSNVVLERGRKPLIQDRSVAAIASP